MSKNLKFNQVTSCCDLLVVKENCDISRIQAGKTVSFDDFKRFVSFSKFLPFVFKYKRVGIVVYRWSVIKYPAVIGLLLRIISRRQPFIFEADGNLIKIDALFLLFQMKKFFFDYFRLRKIIKNVVDDLYNLEMSALVRSPRIVENYKRCNLYYLRTDLWFGLLSGGSVGHIAGVLNNFKNYFGNVNLLSTDSLPLVNPNVCVKPLRLINNYWDFDELPSLFSSLEYLKSIRLDTSSSTSSVIYQRYSINNYTGAYLSIKHNVPFILEYNGSEVWIARNWGLPLKYEALSEKIENINLNVADVVVVVSQPMKNELVARHILADKILVNPNGVDPERYSPEVDGSMVRKKFGLDNKLVIGFIGTFGHWHGAEVLAEAFWQLLQRQPQLKANLHLLMIGDGVTLPKVKAIIAECGLDACCTFAGVVPQADGPSYLAACDVLASPHVPNPDGTPFFGSPTKLFEYMAMGKGIVASNLDQIGEVLSHDKTAWMVKPNDPEELAIGLEHLINDHRLRERLGRAARAEVIAKYTWQEHTRRIIEKLEERCGS